MAEPPASPGTGGATSGGVDNSAFMLEWEPDPDSDHDEQLSVKAEQRSVTREQEQNTNNNARSSSVVALGKEEDDGVELSTIDLPNDTKHKGGVDGVAWAPASTKMSVSDVNGDLTAEQLAEYQRQQQENRDREPLRFCKWITDKPGLMFGLTLGGHILFILITAILVRTGYDILPITFDRIPLDIRDDVDYLRGLAWSGRNDPANNIITRMGSNAANQSERSERSEALTLLFQLPGGNVFTQQNLKLMKTVEDEFYNNPEFQSKFCLLDSNQACTKARSVLRYFDGTYSSLDSTFNDPNFNNIQNVLYKAYTLNTTKSAFQYHLGVNAVIDANTATSDITRGYLLLGSPLAGYANASDREDEQETKVKTFMTNEVKVKAEAYYKSGVGQMKFIYNSGTLLGLTISGQVFKDMALAIGSLVFIIVFVCLQTGTLWVALWAIFGVIASFAEANIFYRVVLDFRYFGIFHVLAIFIILGIGADDVFVFFDTWKETAHHKYKSLAHRLSDCYRKASLAMLFTSLTTGIAFAISASSPFLGIGSFGVFSTVLILVDYISVIVFFPCVVVTYHLWFEKYTCCCCCPRKMVGDDPTGPQDTQRKNIIVRFFAGPYYRFITHKWIQKLMADNSDPDNEHRKNFVVRFFAGPFYRLIVHEVIRWFILLFYAVLIALSIYFAAQLKINEEQIKFLPDSSNFGQYLSLRSDAFASTSETGSKVMLVWGLKQQDLSSCHKTDPGCFGKTVWDDTFDLNSADAQNKLLALCTDLKALSKAETDSLSIRRSLVDDVPEVQCFVEEMKVFYQVEGSRVYPAPFSPYPGGTSFSYPLDSTEVNTIMTTNNLVYDTSQLPAGFNRHFEVATSFWLFNGFRISPTSGLDLGDQLTMHSSYLGEEKTTDTVEKSFSATGMSYFYATRLRYAAIVVNTTITASNFGYPKGLPIRDRWEDYATRQMAQLPTSLKGGFQIMMGGQINVWHWFKTQKTLAESALMGVGIGIAVACPILIFATQNVIVGVLATFTICCITCSVIAVIPLAGWKLGMLESLNLVLVVGLAVDYVVHLAEGYSRCIYQDRKRRTQSALEEVGISVLSGAITTLGASAFLLGAFILFFTQFGIFMFSTIGFSILYALGMFTTLVALLGPQGEVGSLKPMWRWCFARCCPSKATTPAASHSNMATGQDQKF